MRYSSYKGMRWHKCNLHLHTAADSKNWLGDRLEEGKESVAARAFAEACYQQRFDIIAVTDHNFLSKNFIPHLQSAFEEIEREFSHKITLLPGFEFEAAGVGKGVHILCLFDPKTDLTRVDSILTECGVNYPRRNLANQLEKSDKNLKDILRVVQKNMPVLSSCHMQQATMAFSMMIRYLNGCNKINS